MSEQLFLDLGTPLSALDVLALAIEAHEAELRSMNARMHVLEVALATASWGTPSPATEPAVAIRQKTIDVEGNVRRVRVVA